MAGSSNYQPISNGATPPKGDFSALQDLLGLAMYAVDCAATASPKEEKPHVTTKRRCIFAGQSLAWLEAYEQASASNPDKLQLERASRDDDESLKIINLFNWEKNPDGQGKDVTRLSTRCTQCENTGLADCYISRRKLLSGQILSSACARCVRLHSRCEFSEKDLEHIAVYQQSGVKLWEGENTRDQTQTQEPMQLTHGMANASSNCTPADQEKSTISGNQDTPLPRDEYGELYDSLVDDGWQSLRIG
ncbi:uncharacterized protein I303_107772 [Kwoniella dejecticola CBS 10117]|uniref:Uncharacterized protein n=1 Tax=Kwoniella dejecticola CBS 10117 TaxID=1296121 RepID=A0A1A5ZVP0_9TREE|nr:uncharacterized protein I303_07777 [Kwoniella dejecticola CBS 10117]OBR81867.1 hypothetical protein I303_07777 [Kwoniella dejecticola CBS 10117]